MGLELPHDFDMDIFCVAAGLRALGKLEHVPDRSLNATCSKIERRKNLHTRAVAGPEPGQSVVFISSKQAILEEAFRLEKLNRARGVAAQRREASKKLGILLGYPECCVESFTNAPRQDDAEILASLDASLDDAIHPLMNFFPRAFAPVGFVPCSLKCAPALKHAKEIAKALNKHFGLKQDDLENALRGVVLWFQGPLFLSFRGITNISKSGFDFDHVLSSVQLVPEANARRHKKGAGMIDELASSINRGNRLALTPEKLLVYAGDDEVFSWAHSSLAQRFMCFGT